METTLSTEQVLEGNRMIAEFMGAKHGISINHFGNAVAEFMDYAECDIKPDDREDQVWMHHVFYHTSFDWLMPVVGKISRMQLKYSNAEEYYYPYPRTFGMLDEDGNFMVRLNSEPLFKAPTLIEATYLAVLHIVELLSTPIKTENSPIYTLKTEKR